MNTGRTRIITIIGSLAFSLLAPTLAHAQLYQWRDNNGRVVFSDQPPPPNIAPGNIMKTPKAPSKPVATAVATTPAKDGAAPGTPGAPSKVDAKANAPKSLAEREADYKKRQAEAAEKAEKDAQTAAADSRREESCRGMRQSLSALESGQRVRRFNDKGEPYFVDDADRGKEIEKSKREMAAAKCS